MNRLILITNDDGISSEGLIALARAASRLGEVWVVAPDSQRSAVSHAITLHGTFDVFPAEFPVDGVRAFSCTGTPSDCVRIGALTVLPRKPDAVLSGINKGYNTATDIQYSGTAGAAFEGAFQGCLSIAFSEQARSCHEVSEAYLGDILEELMGRSLLPGQIWNVNFPGCPLAECRGVLYDRTVSEGMFYRDRYRVVEELPGGGVRYEVEGIYNEDAEEGTDFRAVVENYISVGIVNNVG
ncbi:MAG: 5'/3'-nucleotidase SurE [Ruminococcus sp.]|nr:5'/3'-nucleotidase SurE [Ruminococcus sp.]